VSLLLVDAFRLSPEQTTYYYGAIFVPWILKPLYGLLSDNAPLFGLRRQPYMFICCAGAGACYLAMALDAAANFRSFFALSVASAVCFAWAELGADSITVEIGNRALRGGDAESDGDADVDAGAAKSRESRFISEVQTTAMLARTAGSFLSTAAAIGLYAALSPRGVLLVAGLACVPAAALVLFLPDRHAPMRLAHGLRLMLSLPRLRARGAAYLRVLRVAIAPLAFIFLLNAAPSSDDSYAYYLVEGRPEFAPWQRALFSFLGLTGSLVAALAYRRYLARLSLRLCFLCAALFAALAGVSELLVVFGGAAALHMPDSVLIALDSMFVQFSSRLALLPAVILAAHNSPVGAEATFFALYACVGDLGVLASAALSARLTRAFGVRAGHYDNLWQLIVVCNAAALLPLPLLAALRDRHVQHELSGSEPAFGPEALATEAGAESGVQPLLPPAAQEPLAEA
jgi:hypothetical protein